MKEYIPNILENCEPLPRPVVEIPLFCVEDRVEVAEEALHSVVDAIVAAKGFSKGEAVDLGGRYVFYLREMAMGGKRVADLAGHSELSKYYEEPLEDLNKIIALTQKGEYAELKAHMKRDSVDFMYASFGVDTESLTELHFRGAAGWRNFEELSNCIPDYAMPFVLPLHSYADPEFNPPDYYY